MRLRKGLYVLKRCPLTSQWAGPVIDRSWQSYLNMFASDFQLENANNNSIYFIRLLGLNELIYKVLRIVRNTVNSE